MGSRPHFAVPHSSYYLSPTYSQFIPEGVRVVPVAKAAPLGLSSLAAGAIYLHGTSYWLWEHGKCFRSTSIYLLQSALLCVGAVSRGEPEGMGKQQWQQSA